MDGFTKVCISMSRFMVSWISATKVLVKTGTLFTVCYVVTASLSISNLTGTVESKYVYPGT